MRVRKLITDPKVIQDDSGWRNNDLPPRNAPIFPRTQPVRAGWEWRSARAVGNNAVYVLLVRCHVAKANWKAWLLKLDDASSASVVARFEEHATHPGLHLHAHCDRGGIEPGPSGLHDLERLPTARRGSYHRRIHDWTRDTFWQAAKRFFRVQDRQGVLPL